MPDHGLEELRNTAASPARFSGENLSLLYQGIITAVVRVRSGDRPIGDVPSFRKNILDMKVEVEQEAFRLTYEKRHVEDATFAVVAYVDESILGSNDPNRNQWAALQSELFGRAVSGEDFFKRLDGLLRQPSSLQLADVLEVYLLCLLLGYQGRYGDVAPGELRRVAADLKDRIDLIRGRNERLSPDDLLPPVGPSISSSDRAAVWLRRGFLALLPIVTVLWIWFRVTLSNQATRLVDTLRQG